MHNLLLSKYRWDNNKYSFQFTKQFILTLTLFYFSGMHFIDFDVSFGSGSFVELLIDLLASYFSRGGSLTLLLLTKNLGTRFSSFSSFTYLIDKSFSITIDFSDFTFFDFILNEADDSLPNPVKHTVFLLDYSNFDLGNLSFKNFSIFGHSIGSIIFIWFAGSSYSCSFSILSSKEAKYGISSNFAALGLYVGLIFRH